MRRELICIVGIDGSGKTTQALRLFSDLKKTTKCKYLWLRSSYFFSLPFMFFCRTLGLVSLYILPNNKKRVKHHYHRNKPIALIWPWIQLVDLLFLAALRIYILSLFFFVVCDRYIHDVLVDIMVDTNNRQLHKKLVGRLMLRLIRRSAKVLLLDVDEMIALQRKNDIANFEYLSVRRELYHTIATYLKIPVIDGGQGFSLVYENIIKELKTRRCEAVSLMRQGLVQYV